MTYLFLAPGFEEIEALATVDILRRADISVTTVSILDTPVVPGAHNVPVTADTVIGNVDLNNAEMLILPGGMPGATNLAATKRLTDALLTAKCRIAAICASPAVVLAPLGILNGKEAICYPGFESKLTGSRISDNVVVTDGNVTTAAGPGFTMEFALELVRLLRSDNKADEVASGLLLLQ
ncbi:MAG: DJ-1/PfpI family protein [bacterium]|nr:DJ-1/PfpI family protein [Candidatus Colousia faecequi]